MKDLHVGTEPETAEPVGYKFANNAGFSPGSLKRRET
jgi:hypothetical protein